MDSLKNKKIGRILLEEKVLLNIFRNREKPGGMK
jgi:hypothetical protein